MKKIQTHYDVNGFHFIDHHDGTNSIISRSGHSKLEFNRSKQDVLVKFKDALCEYLASEDKWGFDPDNKDQFCLGEFNIKIYKDGDTFYADTDQPPVINNSLIDMAIKVLQDMKQ